MKRLLLLLPVAAALGLLLAGQRARSQPPDDFGVLKTRPAAQPSPGLPTGIAPAQTTDAVSPSPPNPYPLTREVGPWLICAANYQGPDGAELARQVCVYLRENPTQRMAAYIFNRGAEERKQQEQEWQRQQQMQPNVPLRHRRVRIPDSFAVLVGGFASFESASDFLPKVKSLTPPELRLPDGREAYDLVTYQEVDPQTKKVVYKRARMNPFQNAMVAHNPLVANSVAAKPKWDPLWKKFNEDEEYSLLKNPKPVTLVVKEYTGGSTIQSHNSGSSPFLAALGLGGRKEGEGLSAAGAQAHELAKFLRNPRLGFKAYVLHTRQSSIVTVGEFTGPDDPNLERVQRQLAALRFQTDKGQVDPIGLLPNPIAVEVPRP
jgi:hypothetical protein